MSTEPPVAALPDIHALRAHFPALAQDTVFLENAGGSQVPESVSDAIRDYMRTTYVQLEAGYELSQRATETVNEAHRFMELFMNAGDAGRVILGPSSTALCMMLASAHRNTIEQNDEIVVAQCGHETNIGPWVRLAEETGARIIWWQADPKSTSTTIDALRPIVNGRTRFVCFPHVSNLLGEIIDVPAATQVAHDAGARVVVDAVAYAPHRAIDVESWDVDYYFFSTYKVYGPHMAALFAKHDALRALTGPNHFFVPQDEVPYKFEPGGVSHEGCAGLLGVRPYLSILADEQIDQPVARATIERAFDVMTALESPLQTRLIDYLNSKDDVRMIGPAHGESSRVGTISFVHASRTSREIDAFVTARNIGVRHGHMYAYRLCEAMGIDLDDGVLRVSLVHYNTMDEIERLIEVFEEIL